MFRTVPLPIIRSIPLYARQCNISYRFYDSLRAASECNATQIVLIHRVLKADGCQ